MDDQTPQQTTTPAPDQATDQEETRDELDLYDWPDELIRAVAVAEPGLLRVDDPFAVHERGLEAYARSLAEHSLEKEDLGYLDVAGYAAVLRDRCFRRFAVGADVWYVCHWQDDTRDLEEPDLPQTFASFDLEEWPDALVAAVGAQAPQLLRTLRGELWAISEEEFPRYALYWIYEGTAIDPRICPFVDAERFIADAKATRFTKVLVDAERWYVRREDDAPAPAWEDEGVLHLGLWSDELVAACAAQLPATFRTHDYESILAVGDDDLERVLERWSDGPTAAIAQAGGPEAYRAKLAAQFRPVTVNGEAGSRCFHVHEAWVRPSLAAASA